MEFIFVVAFFVALIAMKKFNIIPFGMNVQTQDPPALPIDTSEIAKLIGETVRSIFQEERSKSSQPPPPAQSTNTTRVGITEFIKPWQRRSVKQLNALVFQYRGVTERASQLFSEVNKELKEMPEELRQAETAETLHKIRNSGLSENQQIRLMSSLTGAEGGYTVLPAPLLAEIFILVEKWGYARRYFRPIPMVTDSLKMSSIVTEAIAYWVTQGNKIPASDLAFGDGELKVFKLAGISAWTSELEEDQAIAVLPLFVESLARAIYKQEDLAGFVGDGSATYGGFTGMINVAGKIVVMDVGKTSFANATADDYKKLRDALPIDQRDGAQYFLHPTLVSELEGLKDNQGNYIYRKPSEALPATLWGYPIANSLGIPALPGLANSAPDERFAVFGNPRNTLMGQRRQIELVISKEGILDNGTDILFNTLQQDGAIVRLTERVGFKTMLSNAYAVLKTAAM